MRPTDRILTIARAVLATSPILWLTVPPLRHLVEASMSLHMLLQLPLLFAAGWAAAASLPRQWVRRYACVDAHGLTSATLATGISAFWMIPAALDLAVLEPVAAWLKYGSWMLAGLLLAQGWQRLGAEVSAFFLGNAAWMLITAGLLYRDADTRVCVSYRFDEQAVSGNGLVLWGMVVGGMALWRLRAMLRGLETPTVPAPASGAPARNTER